MCGMRRSLETHIYTHGIPVWAHTYTCTLLASTALPNPIPGDVEQEVMLTTKTPKATVGGLSPSKGYTLQIFELTGSGNVLLAQREFVSKSTGPPCGFPSLGVSVWQGGCSRALAMLLGWQPRPVFELRSP